MLAYLNANRHAAMAGCGDSLGGSIKPVALNNVYNIYYGYHIATNKVECEFANTQSSNLIPSGWLKK
ncbi:MAG: hypothetical protein ACOH2B_05345 [Burkholderiaceae bacterium]